MWNLNFTKKWVQATCTWPWGVSLDRWPFRVKFNKRKVWNKIAYSKNTASAKSIYTHKKRMMEKIYNAYNFIIHIHTHTYINTYIYTHTHTKHIYINIYIYIYIYIYTYIYLSDFLRRYFGLIRRVTKSVTICPPPPPSSSSKRFRTWNRTQIVKNLNYLGLPKSNYSLTV